LAVYLVRASNKMKWDARSARIFWIKKAFPGDPGVLAFMIIFISSDAFKDS